MDVPPEAPPRKLRLDQFLKLQGITPTGGQAKLRIQAGEVRVNGEIELRRGHGLRHRQRIIRRTRLLKAAARLAHQCRNGFGHVGHFSCCKGTRKDTSPQARLTH